MMAVPVAPDRRPVEEKNAVVVVAKKIGVQAFVHCQNCLLTASTPLPHPPPPNTKKGKKLFVVKEKEPVILRVCDVNLTL